MDSYATQQQAFLSKHKLTIGSKVKIFKRVKTYQDGWGTSWANEMDKFVGNEPKTIKVIDNLYGICFEETNGYYFPHSSLKPAKLKLG